MADLNKVMLIGRLTRDPQLKFLPNQTPICEFGFAVGRKFKAASGEMREETAFIDCTIFGKGGEVFSKYMAKGRQVYLEGRLKFDSWEDKNGGGKRSKLSVVVDDFQFLGDGQGQGGGQRASAGGGEYSSGGDEGGGPPPARPMSRGPARPQQQPPAQAPYGEEQQFNEDDIPF